MGGIRQQGFERDNGSCRSWRIGIAPAGEQLHRHGRCPPCGFMVKCTTCRLESRSAWTLTGKPTVWWPGIGSGFFRCRYGTAPAPAIGGVPGSGDEFAHATQTLIQTVGSDIGRKIGAIAIRSGRRAGLF